MTEGGVAADHSTIFRWVQQFAPEIEKRLRWQWRLPRSRSWRIDETYVKIRGKWAYLYRAVDKFGNMIDFYLSATRNTKAAKRFLGKALKELKDWEQPEVLNTDKAPTYAVAIAALKAEGKCPEETRHRQVKYLNNVVEADHGKLKLLIRPVRDAALRRFEGLRPHIQDGVALTEAATGRGRSGVQSSLGTHGHRRVTHTNQAPEFPARFRRVRADTLGSSVKKRQGSMNDGRRLFRMEPCNRGSRSIDRPPDLPDMPRRFTRVNNDCGTARRALIPRPRTGFRSTESIPC